MLRLKILVAQLVGTLSRFLRRGGGTSLPGKILLALDSQAIGKLGSELPEGSVTISATNGKTTTANMLASVLSQQSVIFVHNSAGANLASGVATALAAAFNDRRPPPSLGLFEVDEAALPLVADALHPTVFLLNNLFRDQLDRYGELEHIADLWAQTVASHARDTKRWQRLGSKPSKLVLNSDDPLVASLGYSNNSDDDEAEVTYYGVEDTSVALKEMQHASDSKTCRRCGQPLHYEVVLMGHLGHYRCSACGLKRPQPDLSVTDLRLLGMRGSSFKLNCAGQQTEIALPVPGLYNVYNALAAAACARNLGFTLADIKSGLESFASSFGRVESVNLGHRNATVLLIKNPAGTNEVLRTVGQADGELHLLIALNDKIADGRDISWIWDADFELLSTKVAAITCSGTRAAEIALRLKYAGIERAKIEVIPDLAAALASTRRDTTGRHLYILPTYTALLQLKRVMVKQGLSTEFWDRAA